MSETMKRRTFLAGLGALATAPILPPILPAVAEPVLAAKVATGASVAMFGGEVFWIAADGMYRYLPSGEFEQIT